MAVIRCSEFVVLCDFTNDSTCVSLVSVLIRKLKFQHLIIHKIYQGLIDDLEEGRHQPVKRLWVQNHIILIITRNLYCATKCRSKLRDAGHYCTSTKRMTSILRHVADAFPPARQGTILNSIETSALLTNTSMMLNYALAVL